MKTSSSAASNPGPGKLEVRTPKPCLTPRDLSMAYTPGVAPGNVGYKLVQRRSLWALAPAAN
jgi:malic enzyme